MSFRDSERYRKVYSYYRPVPRPTDPGGVSKEYVDDALRAIDWKQSVRVATNASISIAGTFATLNQLDTGAAAVALVDEDRILVKSQSTGSENGIYIWYAATGKLTRALDAAQDFLTSGAACYVEDGTYSGKIFILTTNDPITVGTTSQTWTNFAGGGGSPGGANPNFQYNDGAGGFAGAAEFNYRGSGAVELTGSFVQGYLGAASGLYSHAEGAGTSATNLCSHAEGEDTTATGQAAHAEGFSTSASADYSHAEGESTEAVGSYSHAEGLRTIASGSHQHVGGKYNLRDNVVSLFVVGDGTGDVDVDRHDVLRVNPGRMEVTGTLAVTGSFEVTGSSFLAGDVLELSGSLLVSGASRFEGDLMVTGSVFATVGFSGSLTTLADGSPYLLAGPNITINTNSLGQVEVTGSAGGGGGDVYWSSTTADSIYTSGSVAIRGLDAAVDSPSDIGTDVFFWVSGSLNDGLNRSVFGGDVRISGSLVQGGAANIASGISSHAEGIGTQAIGVGTHAEGNNTYAYEAYSHAEGFGAQSLGLYSHAEGLSTITNAAADGSHAEGNQSQTYAYYSHAEGQFTVTYGESSHAEGIETVASGTYSHAEGYLTYASGTYSHAEGEGTLAVTYGSHSEGFGSTAGITALSPWDGTNLGYAGSGILKLATDYGDVTSYFPVAAGIIFTDFSTYFLSDVVSSSSFDGTHTFITASSNTTLGGPTYVTVSPGFSVPAAYEQPVVSFVLTHAHAEGYATHAAGAFSHAEGYNSKAVGGASHAEGEGTWAFGGASHTEGTGSVAIGTYAHAGGIYTIASGSGQTVIGQYNLHDNMDSLFVVGDGSGDDSTLRHDVLRVNSGSVQVTGSLLLSGVLEWQANIQGSYVKLFTSPLGYSTNLFGDVDQVGERLEFPNLNDNFITATGPTGSFSGVNGGRLHIRAGDALGATGVGGDLYIDPGGSGSLGDRPGMLLFGVKKGASLIGFSGGTTAASAGSDTFFVVSGSVAGTGADDRRAVFVGDMVTSGSYLLNVQSGTLGTEPVVLLVSSSHHLTVFTLGNVTASLPTAAHVGTQLIFKDGTGAASTSPQMVSCSVGLLDGGSTYTLPAVNYSSVTVVKVEEPDTWVVV